MNFSKTIGDYFSGALVKGRSSSHTPAPHQGDANNTTPGTANLHRDNTTSAPRFSRGNCERLNAQLKRLQEDVWKRDLDRVEQQVRAFNKILRDIKLDLCSDEAGIVKH